MVNQTQNGNGVQMTIVKAKYGCDIRKLQLCHNNDLSLNDIISTMQRLFNIKDGSSIHLKYRDEDGDIITIADDNDLILAAQENPLFLHVFSKEDDLHSQFANLSMLINDFKSSAQGLAELIQKISEGCGNKTEIGQNEILLKTEMPQKLEQKPENDNVAVIKPEQAEFSNIPLNQTQDLSIPHPHISQKEYTGQQQPTPYYLNSNVPPPLQTISQNYQPNIPNQSQMQPNQQQMFAPPNIQQHTPTPIPPHPQHQQQHQSFQPSIPPQPNVSSYQQVPGYNSTPPPTSMYQQSIPPQQSFAPPPHVSPYGAIAPPPASSGIASTAGNPFARNPQGQQGQGYRPSPY